MPWRGADDLMVTIDFWGSSLVSATCAASTEPVIGVGFMSKLLSDSRLWVKIGSPF